MKPKNVLAMVSPMSSKRANGIARYAKEHGWHLLIHDRLGSRPMVWNGDGIIATLRPDPASFRAIMSLARRGIPLVDMAINRPHVNVSRVISDHEAIGQLAAQHFSERGFRNVAWFSTDWGNVHRLRFKGFAESSPSTPGKWILTDEIKTERQGVWRNFVQWIKGKTTASGKPLAVLTYDETDAVRLLHAAEELGLNIPEELAILSIGNNPLICENQSVAISSIDLDLEKSGYKAAALLDRLMEKRGRSGQPNNQTILIPPAGIVTRRSTDVIAVTDPKLRKALEFIEANLSKPIGAPQIANFLGLKRSDLDTLCKAQLARSISEEIHHRRFAMAKQLLNSSDLPIREIARKTGFCTPSHLTNAFKSAFGCTPKDWRRTR